MPYMEKQFTWGTVTEIKAARFRKGGYFIQPFVMGGEEGPAGSGPKVRCRGSLWNYLIDTGGEVVPADTVPARRAAGVICGGQTMCKFVKFTRKTCE